MQGLASGNNADTLSISDLAKEFDITPRTIRFYEDEGLIQPARDGLTRVYSQRDRVRLSLILRGKRLGFTIGEISEMLDMYDAPAGPKIQLAFVIEKIHERRSALKRQAKDLRLALKELDEIEERCQTMLSE